MKEPEKLVELGNRIVRACRFVGALASNTHTGWHGRLTSFPSEIQLEERAPAFQRLTCFSGLLAGLSAWHRMQFERGLITTWPSPRQLNYFAAAADLDELDLRELQTLIDAARAAASAAFGSSTQESYIYDGNTVRKSSILGILDDSRQTVIGDALPVDLWVSGGVTPEDEERIRKAVQDLLIEQDAVLSSAGKPIYGSFYQKLKFLGKLVPYSQALVENLGSALGAAANKYQIDAVTKLSAVLKNHHQIVIRIDGMIAVKVTRNQQSHVLIVQIPPPLRAKLNENPALVTDADAIYDFLLLNGGITPRDNEERRAVGIERSTTSAVKSRRSRSHPAVPPVEGSP